MKENISQVKRNKRKWRVKVIAKRKMTREMMATLNNASLDVTISFIQTLIPIGLKAVGEILQQEVAKLAGPRYQRTDDKKAYRWGSQAGSVYLTDQKVPIDLPRVRDKLKDEEIPLVTYQKLQEPFKCDQQTLLKLLNGISTHQYQKCVELAPAVFGLSASTLSRRFKKATEAKLQQLQTRRLDDYDFVAIFIDGKRYAKDNS